MDNIVIDACHGKYESSQIVEYERRILNTLEFKLMPDNVY
jgi:hypothetical protein